MGNELWEITDTRPMPLVCRECGREIPDGETCWIPAEVEGSKTPDGPRCHPGCPSAMLAPARGVRP